MSQNAWKATTALLLVLVPLLFAVNVLQSFRFSSLQLRVRNDREAVASAIETNKRLIAGIASLRSPARIRAIAEEQLSMLPVHASQIVRISVGGGVDGP